MLACNKASYNLNDACIGSTLLIDGVVEGCVENPLTKKAEIVAESRGNTIKNY